MKNFLNLKIKRMIKMRDKGIETGMHYKPIQQMTLYKENLALPISEKIGKSILSIPIHANLEQSDVDKIIVNVNRFAK